MHKSIPGYTMLQFFFSYELRLFVSWVRYSSFDGILQWILEMKKYDALTPLPLKNKSLYINVS